MTKRQKIILALTIILFVLPELIWSPVTNFILIFVSGEPFRDNFTINLDYRSYLLLVLLIQLLGIALTLVFYNKNKRKFLNKYSLVINFILTIISSLTVLVLYSVFATSNITFL